jgi:hypothetical protein
MSIDGKWVRRSFDRSAGRSAIHRVSAWGNANGLGLGPLKTDEKSTEITANPQLLERLELKGRMVPLDAMGGQKAIAEKILICPLLDGVCVSYGHALRPGHREEAYQARFGC